MGAHRSLAIEGTLVAGTGIPVVAGPPEDQGAGSILARPFLALGGVSAACQYGVKMFIRLPVTIVIHPIAIGIIPCGRILVADGLQWPSVHTVTPAASQAP